MDLASSASGCGASEHFTRTVVAGTRLVCIGACAIDTILTVPHFPEEDSKLRATDFSRRRGGNSPNTLEVLQQLIEDDEKQLTGLENPSNEPLLPELFLVAALPARSSADAKLIASSFEPGSKGNEQISNDKPKSSISHRSRVDLSHCIHREDLPQAVSSYIIASQLTSSRTIVNHNALPEPTYEELRAAIENVIRVDPERGVWTAGRFWFHFEGRIPHTTLKCMQYLRNHAAFRNNNCALTISVELEKPGREGLQELALEADVVFYSRAWAQGMNYQSARECLTEQMNIMCRAWPAEQMNSRYNSTLLVCPWGGKGAFAVCMPEHVISRHSNETENLLVDEIKHSSAYIPENQVIVDSTGAGDTFIAGMLYGLVCRNRSGSLRLNLQENLDFANGLAGRKILQNGFGGLGEAARDLRRSIEKYHE